MINKPRIAFCFSWQARTLDQTYLFFQRNLFDAAKEQWFDYDIFCAVEDNEDVDKVKLLNPTKVEKIKSSEVEKIIENKYWDFIKLEYKNKYWFFWNKWCINLLQQFYKISRSILIMQWYQEEHGLIYNLVFKLRFDTPFARKLNFNTIINTITDNKDVILCNKNKLIPSLRFITKIEDFYFITSNENSRILWNIFNNRKECFIWHEIKYKRLNKLFEKLDSFFCPSYSLWGSILSSPINYIYSLFFIPFCPEREWINYIIYNWCKIDTKNYITIWLIKDERKYKKLDFRSHSKKRMFKKWKYEL